MLLYGVRDFSRNVVGIEAKADEPFDRTIARAYADAAPSGAARAEESPEQEPPAQAPNENAVLVAVNVTIRNSPERPLWIHTIKATLKTDSGEFSDDAASSSDFARYFQAFPALKEHALGSALVPEQKIGPGALAQGTVVVSFPVTQDAFDKRKSLSVVIQPYDQAVPVVLTK